MISVLKSIFERLFIVEVEVYYAFFGGDKYILRGGRWIKIQESS